MSPAAGGRTFFSSSGRTLAEEDQIEVLTAGIDIGSSTSHLVFSRIVLERLDSRYEPGQRSGAWRKMRIDQGQEFVIGGYTPSTRNFDALIFGYYEGGRLIYAARTRAGFSPTSRAALYRRFQPLETNECPFANLPEAHSGRWGQGLTAEKMKEYRWLKPVLVGEFEFLEWTPDDHLRHSRFVTLHEGKLAVLGEQVRIDRARKPHGA